MAGGRAVFVPVWSMAGEGSEISILE